VNAFDYLRLLNPGWRDALEIAVVAFACYRLLLLLHGTRAVQMLAGAVVLAAAYAAASLAKLALVTFVLALLFKYGAIAALVALQPELRMALASLGQARGSRSRKALAASEVADEIAEAADRLSRSGIGAIIAVEYEQSLDDHVQLGSEMQARVSADLLATIFTPYSPLHDGAVIVRGDSIVGAGCILPLSQTPITDRSLGTRHRAALGLSEETDAVVVIVSEETSTISTAVGGRLTRDYTPAALRELLAGRALPVIDPAPIA
jgi:diadenylate cyclase